MGQVKQIFNFIWENDYLRFLLIALISLVIAYLSRFITKRILKPLVTKTKTQVDDLVLKSLYSIIFYFVLFLGIKIGFQHFDFQNDTLENLINTLIIGIILLFLLKIIDNFAGHWLKEWKSKTKTTADERLIPLLQKILKAVVIILAGFFILTSWKVNIAPLLTTAGIAGIALGLAVKEPIVNILGGLQLVLDKTFKVNDRIELETGETGMILDIGLRSTKMRTFDNETIYIPNGFLANAKVKNFTQPDVSLRVNVYFGVVYGSDTEKVRTVVLSAIRKVPTVVSDPEPVVQFTKMNDFSLDFVARAWVKEYTDAYTTKIELTDVIYRALGEAHIGIPFPTRTVYTKAAD